MSTIAAISTPHGVGGIAVVRLSGADAFTIAAKHLQLPRNGRDMGFSLFRHNDDILDEVVVSLFHAPHSYTGEDVVEISCHGSLYVQQAILEALLGSGARLADGKLNLSQAEAVADLIDSTNAAAHSLAVSQLRGGYAKELEQLRQQLVDLTALLELELDFSDEDVEFADRSSLHSLASQIYTRVTALRESFHMGNALKRGIPVAIIGRPNAGKSSLLNALLRDNRAIVSDIPGTTRDTIEETFVINGTHFRIIDTDPFPHYRHRWTAPQRRPHRNSRHPAHPNHRGTSRYRPLCARRIAVLRPCPRRPARAARQPFLQRQAPLHCQQQDRPCPGNPDSPLSHIPHLC